MSGDKSGKGVRRDGSGNRPILAFQASMVALHYSLDTLNSIRIRTSGPSDGNLPGLDLHRNPGRDGHGSLDHERADHFFYTPKCWEVERTACRRFRGLCRLSRKPGRARKPTRR